MKTFEKFLLNFVFPPQWCSGEFQSFIGGKYFDFMLNNYFSDVNYLSSTAPPVAAEWQSLLRPLRGREPEGMWNLLSIVREMFKRHDHNAIPLLEVITEECLATEKVTF